MFGYGSCTAHSTASGSSPHCRGGPGVPRHRRRGCAGPESRRRERLRPVAQAHARAALRRRLAPAMSVSRRGCLNRHRAARRRLASRAALRAVDRGRAERLSPPRRRPAYRAQAWRYALRGLLAGFRARPRDSACTFSWASRVRSRPTEQASVWRGRRHAGTARPRRGGRIRELRGPAARPSPRSVHTRRLSQRLALASRPYCESPVGLRPHISPRLSRRAVSWPAARAWPAAASRVFEATAEARRRHAEDLTNADRSEGIVRSCYASPHGSRRHREAAPAVVPLAARSLAAPWAGAA